MLFAILIFLTNFIIKSSLLFPPHSSLTSGNDEDELQPEYDISDDEQESPDEKDSDSDGDDDDAENKVRSKVTYTGCPQKKYTQAF